MKDVVIDTSIEERVAGMVQKPRALLDAEEAHRDAMGDLDAAEDAARDLYRDYRAGQGGISPADLRHANELVAKAKAATRKTLAGLQQQREAYEPQFHRAMAPLIAEADRELRTAAGFASRSSRIMMAISANAQRAGLPAGYSTDHLVLDRLLRTMTVRMELPGEDGTDV